MAVDFSAPHTRRATYLFLPKHLKPHPELNGRYVETDIDDLMQDLAANGQTVPLVIRSSGGTAIIIDGHRRWSAALEGIKRKLLPVEFKLECVYFKGNEQQAFLAAVRANHHRTSANPVDTAHNIAKMERFGMSHLEIAAVYREDVHWVKETLALVTLTKEGAAALATGKLKGPQARKLAKLSEEQQRAALQSDDGIAAATSRPKSDAPKKPTAAMHLAVLEDVLRNIIEKEQMPAGLGVAGMRAEDAVVAVAARLMDLLNSSSDALRAQKAMEKAS